MASRFRTLIGKGLLYGYGAGVVVSLPGNVSYIRKDLMRHTKRDDLVSDTMDGFGVIMFSTFFSMLWPARLVGSHLKNM